ncbi:hypothetical protein [Segetibacter koreensis]|uniref:hypothetical protein n=1 Tax=Segetibacter koreensis TaxID=398037 RepID=UPI00035E3C0A|nr:hypothetical protein [Segetibacter koreensis]
MGCIYCNQRINVNTQNFINTRGNFQPTHILDSTDKDTAKLDTALYKRIVARLAHNNPNGGWPVKTAYPLPGAILPFKRIVAYYGNLYSAGMGILGALPPDQMLAKLQGEVKKWEVADTLTRVQPALHYVAVTAQRKPGASGNYNLRMPPRQIDRILEIAKKINAIVFLDIQVGHSTVQQEIPLLKKYLTLPNVHLGIDPEYSMKYGEVPCSVIGTFDAEDINYASDYLGQLVQEYKLPPKILVVHRFTKAMVTNYTKIETRPQVQIVMNMDGFGYPAKKIDTYKHFIAGEPVQFTGFKLFYKNDVQVPKWPVLMKPEEILKLYPQPIYIQYQ